MPAQVYRSPVGSADRAGGRTGAIAGLCGSADLLASEFFEILPTMQVFTVSACTAIYGGGMTRWVITHNDTALRVGDSLQTPHASNATSPIYAVVVRILNATTCVVDRPVAVGSLQDTTG